MPFRVLIDSDFRGSCRTKGGVAPVLFHWGVAQLTQYLSPTAMSPFSPHQTSRGLQRLAPQDQAPQSTTHARHPPHPNQSSPSVKSAAPRFSRTRTHKAQDSLSRPLMGVGVGMGVGMGVGVGMGTGMGVGMGMGVGVGMGMGTGMGVGMGASCTCAFSCLATS